MESLANNPIALSDCGQYFSYCTLDGQLKIWDTLSGDLKQEYTPSSHLSATCVTMSWPDRHIESIVEPIDGSPKKKRKRKTSTNMSQEVMDLELLALGTINGSILLYSVVKSDLHSQLTNGHEDRVNDMSWLTSTDSLFSCSNDKHVIEWCISTSKVKKKWSPDRSAVTAICAIDSTNVLIANNCIKWLDWSKNTVLKRFSGHASEVHRLRHVRPSESEDILGSYFMSSAVGDRLINAWQLKTESKQRVSTSLASFSLDDEPISLDISPVKANHPILVTVVTKSGFLYIFEHILNGHKKTPINPKVKIQISAPNGKTLPNKQLMIMSAQVCNDREILLIYGSLLTPVFERISYEKCEQNTTLVRKDSSGSAKISLLTDSGFTKIKSPLKPKNATVVGPAGMAPTRQSVTTNDISMNALNEVKEKEKKETKPKQQNEILMTFEERLRICGQNNSDVEPNTSGRQQPSSDSLTHVLVQGLQSKDKEMLETVLHNSDEKLIRNTIKKLPIDCISMFLYELQSCLFNKSEHTLVYLKWLQQLLHLRLTFLMTLPNVDQEFGPLIELMNARTDILDRIYRLKGRLNLMISQICAQNSTEYISRQKPRIDYESSSSSSSEAEDEDLINDELIEFSDNNSDDDNHQEVEEHQSSDESLSEENEEEEDSNVNDLETD